MALDTAFKGWLSHLARRRMETPMRSEGQPKLNLEPILIQMKAAENLGIELEVMTPLRAEFPIIVDLPEHAKVGPQDFIPTQPAAEPQVHTLQVHREVVFDREPVDFGQGIECRVGEVLTRGDLSGPRRPRSVRQNRLGGSRGGKGGARCGSGCFP